MTNDSGQQQHPLGDIPIRPAEHDGRIGASPTGGLAPGKKGVPGPARTVPVRITVDRAGDDVPGDSEEAGRGGELPPPAIAGMGCGSETVRLRRSRSLRGWQCLLLSLVLLGLLLAGGLLILPGMVRSSLVRWGSQQLGMTLHIDLVRCNPFSGNLVVRGLQAVPSGQQGPPPLTLREAALQLSPSSLWRRQIIAKTVRLTEPTVHLVRQHNQHYNLERLLPWLPLGDHKASRGGIAYALYNVEVHGGRLTFVDEPRGKTHEMDDVHLTLPSLATVPTSLQGSLSPAFSARINGSPVRFSGSDATAGDGAAQEGTKLGFQLQQLDLVQYQNYWPWPLPGLVVRSGRADSNVSLVFQGRQEGVRLTLDGTVELHDVVVEKGDGLALSLPYVHLEFSANPWQRQYLVREAVLRAPEASLRLTDARSAALGVVRGMLGTSPALSTNQENTTREKDAVALGLMGLRLDNLQVEGGRLVLFSGDGSGSRRDELRDLRLTLHDYASLGVLPQMRPQQKVASIELAGRSAGGASEATLSLQGSIDPAQGLDALIDLQNFDLAWYQAVLPGLAEARGVGGRGRLQARLTTGGGTGKDVGVRLSDGQLALTEYSWQEEQWGKVRGKELSCQEFKLDMSARTGSCERLALHAADLRLGPAAAAALFGPHDKNGGTYAWRWQFRNVDIRTAQWHLPLRQEQAAAGKRPGPPAELLLTEVSLQAKQGTGGQATEDNTLTLSARLGERGRVEASGSWRGTGRDNTLQLGVKDVELVLLKPFFSSWLRPELTGGRLHLRGNLAFPGIRFGGMAWLEDVRAGREDESRIHVERVFASSLAATLDPFHLGIGEMTVHRPEIVALPTAGGGESPSGLQAFVHVSRQGGGRKQASSAIAIPQVEVQRIEVEDGSIRLPAFALQDGLMAELAGVRGKIADVRLLRGSRYVYDLTARPVRAAAEAGVVLRGEGSPGEGVVRGVVEGHRLPAVAFGGLSELALNNASMELSRQWPEGPDGATVTRLRGQGLRPRDEASALASVMALLTDHEGVVHLRIEDLPDEEAPVPLAASVARLLRRYGVKAELSPALILAETWPELQPAEMVHFAAGDSMLSDTARQHLGGQLELLRQRPAVVLRLKPDFDAQADRRAVQERLQREADAARAEENRRRELLRRERSEMELKRLAAEAAKRGSDKMITVEELPPDPPELEPLPPTEVDVSVDALVALARSRAKAVRDYLQREKGVASHRLVLEEPEGGGSTAAVRLGVGADFVRADFRRSATD